MRTADQIVRFNYWLNELTSSQYMATLANARNDVAEWVRHIADRDAAHKALVEMYENA